MSAFPRMEERTEIRKDETRMKRKQWIAAILCVSLTVSAPMAALAEEGAQTETEMERESAAEKSERPDYDALDYVELGGYSNLEVTVDQKAVTEEDVLEEADELLRASNAMIPADTVQDGDEVVIDYQGAVDGEDLEGASGEDYELEIGSGLFVDGFETGLIGASAGDTVTLDLTFPEDYYYESLAGEDAEFTVTIEEILRVPELTDETVVSATNGEYADVTSWLDVIRADLENQLEEDWEYDVQEALLQALAACSVITGYPQDLLDYTVNDAVAFYTELAGMYPSLDYTSFIEAFGYSEDSFDEVLRQMAEASLEEELLLMAVAEQEGITLSEEEYQSGVANYASQYGFDSTEEFENAYEEAYGSGELLRISLLMDKVFDFLQENATIVEVEAEEEAETQREEYAESERAG